MKGGYYRAAFLLSTQHGRDPSLHLSCGLVRESKGKDAFRRNSLGNKVGHPHGDDPRLAASSPCKHKQRPFGAKHGLFLAGIEAVDLSVYI